ncbi:metalloregulator ArsR/SmtB family transcription factor [Devosia rhodophyticola]|uniref:Metalloregulator ArsR/SmtB family transcription factor n=1 Tax=Devosia rhodophyticola TaxID=3026423 RepID=A0ABY7YW21_9HYPH|nr:metalloregulator ArsR/SmtB family transcription factor [Devosia rhodophyticola]WDR05402.1 metalloregulator ArsR/SmtB family transcription factor [Devosia rhodophyticola]
MNAAALPLADDRLDIIFQALANRTRRALVARLAQGAAKVTDLAAPFEMSLAAISKHLLVLENAGMVDRSVQGRVHICALNTGALASADQWLDTYKAFWDDKLENFAQFVETENAQPPEKT